MDERPKSELEKLIEAYENPSDEMIEIIEARKARRIQERFLNKIEAEPTESELSDPNVFPFIYIDASHRYVFFFRKYGQINPKEIYDIAVERVLFDRDLHADGHKSKYGPIQYIEAMLSEHAQILTVQREGGLTISPFLSPDLFQGPGDFSVKLFACFTKYLGPDFTRFFPGLEIDAFGFVNGDMIPPF